VWEVGTRLWWRTDSFSHIIKLILSGSIALPTSPGNVQLREEND
jgi:hypothetical protein